MARNILLATPADAGAVEVPIGRSALGPLVPFLTPEQLATSFEAMTLDDWLVATNLFYRGGKRGRDQLLWLDPATGFRHDSTSAGPGQRIVGPGVHTCPDTVHVNRS